MTDIVEKASVVGVLTGSERISPVMDAVLAQVGLKADLFHTFMAELKETNRHLWGVIQQYYCEWIIMSKKFCGHVN